MSADNSRKKTYHTRAILYYQLLDNLTTAYDISRPKTSRGAWG